MKQMQIIPKDAFKLYGALVRRELELRKKNQGTFRRVGGGTKDTATWKHKGHAGRVRLTRGLSGIVVGEIRSHAGAEDEWKIFHAFIGFIDRTLGKNVAAINIQFVE
jgi:hypothetical protein